MYDKNCVILPSNKFLVTISNYQYQIWMDCEDKFPCVSQIEHYQIRILLTNVLSVKEVCSGKTNALFVLSDIKTVTEQLPVTFLEDQYIKLEAGHPF